MCSLQPSDGLQGIGKEGILRLEFQKRDRRTLLTESFSRMPLQAFPPFYPDETGCACTYLVNPTGGLVGGDRMEVEIDLRKEAHAFLAVPSATKVYKTPGPFASQEMRVRIGREAVWEYFPSYVIPFGGSRYRQKMRVQMAENSKAIILDFLTAGRVGRGERFQFHEYRSLTEIEYSGELILSERFFLKPPETDYSGLGLLEDYSASAALYAIFDEASLEIPLINDLRGVIHRLENIAGGVSSLPAKGVILRLLGKSVADIEEGLFQVWSLARERILNLKSTAPIARLISLR